MTYGYPELSVEEFHQLWNNANEGYGVELPKRTYSISLDKKEIVKAVIWEKDGKVWISKLIGNKVITEIYFEDSQLYNKLRKFAFKEKVLRNYLVKQTKPCPFSCGLCSGHFSHTCLLNIVLTNRCDLSCWYCFFYLRENQPVYEPSLEQIRFMLKKAKELKPEVQAVQFTGGEPLLRKDIVEIIKIAKEEGYTHIQLNTHGIKLAHDKELLKKVTKAGVNTIYLSFDGVSETTNPKNHWEIPLIFKNIREVHGPGLVLVPTVIRTVNDKELGKIINFALNHIDIVRGVNFQPISIVGKVPKEERQKLRITIAGAIKEIEEQTNGIISKEDWYPVPVAAFIGKFISLLTNKEYYLSSHFICGVATYLFIDENKKIIPITRFIDVDGLIEYLIQKIEELSNKMKSFKKLKLYLEIPKVLNKFFDKEKAPKNINLIHLLKTIFTNANYKNLGSFHHKTLFVGMMHFQDEYNYDIERTQRCVIHYATPDGKIIPFCSFNVLPEYYREEIQRKYSYSWEEWKAKNPNWDLKKEKYNRTEDFINKIKMSELYRKTYIDIVNYF